MFDLTPSLMSQFHIEQILGLDLDLLPPLGKYLNIRFMDAVPDAIYIMEIDTLIQVCPFTQKNSRWLPWMGLEKS